MIRVVKDKVNDQFEWIDIADPTPEELKEIAVNYNIHMPSLLDCLQPEHLPKFELVEDWIFIMLRVHDSSAKKEADTIQELSRKLAVFYCEKVLITIHRTDSGIIQKLTGSHNYSKKNTNSVMALFNVINLSLQSFVNPGQVLLKELDEYETEIFIKNQAGDVLKSLYHLKRKAAVSNRILNLSTDIIDHLDSLEIPETLVQDLRDLYIRLETMYSEVQEGVNNLLNIYISLSSQKTNDVVRVLTVFSVFFMPLTFIVGIYGMNFQNMPELRMKFGYPGVLALMAGVTMSIYFWFRRKNWL